MFSAQSSAPPPAPSKPHSRFISSALRGTGLVDADAKMHDAPSARRNARHKVYERPRPEKDQAPSIGRRSNMLPPKPSPRGPPTPFGIRGAASGSSPGHLSSLATRLGAASGPSSIPRLRELKRPEPKQSVDVLRQFVESRWNREARFLNLERMADDPLLKKHNIASLDSPQAPKAMGPVILKLASKLEPRIVTLSIANNSFTSLSGLSTLNHYLPQLANLSLEKNQIKSYRDLDRLLPTSKTGAKPDVSALKELILKGNPLRKIEEEKGQLIHYKSEISKRFPMLDMLDQEPLAKISFDVPLDEAIPSSSSSTSQFPSTFPVPVSPGVVAPQVAEVTAQFLTKFFTLFDSSRTELLAVYAPNATFSHINNTHIPERARKGGLFHNLPNQKKLEWTLWHAGNRDLSRGPSIELATRTLKTGPDEIGKTFNAMVGTKHTIEQQEKYVVDAWAVGDILPGNAEQSATLFITVHGEFLEVPSMGIRSFDRSFVLAVAPQGSPALLAGWPCVVLSDQLVIRNYSLHDAWAPGPIAMQGLSSSSVSAESTGMQTQPQSAATDAETRAKSEAVGTLAAQTGLTQEYAFQCLEGNGWDRSRALANFHELKASLPAEAFSAGRRV